jgi:hypothetical protein
VFQTCVFTTIVVESTTIGHIQSTKWNPKQISFFSLSKEKERNKRKKIVIYLTLMSGSPLITKETYIV